MNKKNHALIIVENSSVPPDIRVEQEATTLRDAGWNISIICPFEKLSNQNQKAIYQQIIQENFKGITIYGFSLEFAEKGIKSYLFEYLSAFFSIARLSWFVWCNHRFSVIHFCNPPDIFFPIAFFYRLLGTGVIFDHHDLFPEFVSVSHRGLVRNLFYILARFTEYLTFQSAHVVLSTNESYRQIALKRGNKLPNKVVVVRNGPKINFSPVEPVHSLKRGFTYSVCYAGVMGIGDGVLELVQTINYVVHELGRKDILFVLLGDGSVFLEVKDQVTSLGLKSYVYMPGMIRDKLLLRQHLCTADILLSPEPNNPLNNYSTFVKVAEYMAMGKPIVASDLVETRYTAQDAAFYVEPGNTRAFGDAITFLLNNLELCKYMGKVGQQRVQNELCWENQQSQLIKAYSLASGL